MLRKCTVEFIGTFFLVLTIGQVVIGAGNIISGVAPIAIGSVLMVMVYAGGHISGAHYNPAVTLSVWLRGETDTAELLPYWLAQFGGGILASFAIMYLEAGSDVTPLAPDVVPALVAEFLFTFALCYVILNVATVRSTKGNSYYGLAIGFTVLAGAYAVGNISRAAFNPAVAVGLVSMNLVALKSLWIYLLANVLGGLAAAAVFNGVDLGSESPADIEASTEPAAAPATSENKLKGDRR